MTRNTETSSAEMRGMETSPAPKQARPSQVLLNEISKCVYLTGDILISNVRSPDCSRDLERRPHLIPLANQVGFLKLRGIESSLQVTYQPREIDVAAPIEIDNLNHAFQQATLVFGQSHHFVNDQS